MHVQFIILQKKNDSPSYGGDCLPAGVGDVLLLVLPGVVQDDSAPRRIRHNT